MKKRTNRELKELVDRLKEIDRQYVLFPTPDFFKEGTKKYAKHDSLLTYLIENQLVKSKSQLYIDSDKSGMFLANQLKAASVRRQITKILNKDGDLVTDHKEIIDGFKEFYSDLYKSEFPDNTISMENILSKLNILKLSSESRIILDKPFSTEEIFKAIGSLQFEKAPSPDSYPVEFFKSFIHLIAPYLAQLFQIL